MVGLNGQPQHPEPEEEEEPVEVPPPDRDASFDSDEDYYGTVEGGIDIDRPSTDDAPGVPGKYEDHGGEQQLRVNTEALELFSKKLGQLGDAVRHSAEYVNPIHVRAGAFAAANLLEERINGAGSVTGLRGDVLGFMKEVQETMFDLQTDIATVVRIYDGAEELNAATSKELDKLMSESSTKISGLGEFGDTSTSGGGGSDTGDGGSDSNGDGDGDGDEEVDQKAE